MEINKNKEGFHYNVKIGFIEIITLILFCSKVFGYGVASTWTWFQIFKPMILVYGIFLVIAIIVIAVKSYQK